MSVCLAAYHFLAAFGNYSAQVEQLQAQQVRLRMLTLQQEEYARSRAMLAQVSTFSDQAAVLKLNRSDWLFYDVNVQGDFTYEVADQLIRQCSASTLAYYWPQSLEIKAVGAKEAQAQSPPGVAKGKPGDVQLTVKGQFVARRQ